MTERFPVAELASMLDWARRNLPSLWPDELDELMPYKERAVEAIESFERPEKQPFGVSARGGELYVAEWLTWMGLDPVRISPERRDGGFDLEAGPYLVQVKTFSRDWVGVAPVRELYGVAQSEGKPSMFWVKGPLSDDARAFADKVEMPVFQFSPEEGLIQPLNDFASQIYTRQQTIKAFKFLVAGKISLIQSASRALNACLNAMWMLRDSLSSTLASDVQAFVQEVRQRQELSFLQHEPEELLETLSSSFLLGAEDNPEFDGSTQVFSDRLLALQAMGQNLRLAFEETVVFLESRRELLDRELPLLAQK
jgi:hypothetical protein